MECPSIDQSGTMHVVRSKLARKRAKYPANQNLTQSLSRPITWGSSVTPEWRRLGLSVEINATRLRILQLECTSVEGLDFESSRLSISVLFNLKMQFA